MAKRPAAKKQARKRAAGAKTDGKKLLTRQQLANALEKHPMTITKWEQAGMPVAHRGGKGRPSLYSEPLVRSWLHARDERAKLSGAVDLTQERARKERAQAVLAEQTYQIRTRDLIPRQDVTKAWVEESSAMRAILTAWPSTIADRLFRAAISDGLGGVEEVLEQAVQNVMRELSDVDRPPGIDAPTLGAASAA